MNVLSFDPGHHVGISLWSEGDLILCSTVSDSFLYRRRVLESLVRATDPDWVIVEDIPSNRVDERTSKIFHYLTNWFRTVGIRILVVAPGHWKGLVDRAKLPASHGFDSATMAKWAIQSGKLESSSAEEEN